MQFLINENGGVLQKSGERFLIFSKDRKIEISSRKISSILISGSTRITTGAIELAVQNNIDIVLLDKYGFPYGRY